MIEITVGQLIAILVGISGLFMAVVSRLSKARGEQVAREQAAMWKRLDENRTVLSTMKDDLHVRYYDRDEVRELVALSILPITTKIDSQSAIISEVKQLVARNNDMMSRLVAD